MWLQVLGLFTVLATTLGVVFLEDPEGVASTAGLNVLGILLLVLNVAFVLLMAALILMASRGTIKKYLGVASAQVKSKKALVSKLSSRARQLGSTSNARAISLDRAASPSQDVALVHSPSSSYPAA